MTTTLVGGGNPTATVSGSTGTFSYTPLATSHLVVIELIWQSTTRTLTNITCSVPANATFANVTAASSSLFTVGYAMVMCLPHAVAALACTAHYSGTITLLQLQVSEFATDFIGPSWSLIAGDSNANTSNNATALSKGTIAGVKNDVYVAAVTANGTSPTAGSAVQSYLTYDLADALVYGDLPSALTVPATGFAVGASAPWVVSAGIFRPGGTPPSKGPVPQVVGYGSII